MSWRPSATFHALIHPATEDPCPLAVLEAMAARLQVIACDGGRPELVVSGDTGVLVLHGRVELLADAIRAMYPDPATADDRVRWGGTNGCTLRAGTGE